MHQQNIHTYQKLRISFRYTAIAIYASFASNCFWTSSNHFPCHCNKITNNNDWLFTVQVVQLNFFFLK